MMTTITPEDAIKISRRWAMPNKWTFRIKPIEQLIVKYQKLNNGIWIDPFSGKSSMADITNDINPEHLADFHLDAEEFVCRVQFDHVIFDPPYSPRQISECYKSIGKLAGMKETQNALLYSRVRNAITEKIKPGGIVISFGWNSNGFGKTRGYKFLEIMLVAHGGAHNDTICVVEEKL